MSINCNSKNPLQRDGTSQEQRTLKTLLPGYVAVDEQNMEDLKSFVVKYAKEINYFDLNNSVNGDWEDFFNKKLDSNSQYNSPHFTLFMAFLKLFKYAQNEMNLITKKHLDFYYRDVLHLTENPAVPDQVFLIFELAKHVTSALLKKDVDFKAGKDNLGNNLVYTTKNETTLNLATISELKAVFTNKHDIFSGLVPYPANNYRLYASPQVNTEDGKGGELTNEEKSWRTFGSIKFPQINSGTPSATIADRELAEVGFAFASPNLFLAEGERTVTLYLNLSSPISLLEKLTDEILLDAFTLKFSGAETWIEFKSTIAKRILEFLNNAKSAEEIAGIEPVEGPVFDDPDKGFSGSRKGYDIGLTVAKRIITTRDALPGGKFTTLNQVKAVKYLGADKINDLIYTFGGPQTITKVDIPNNRIIISRTITRDQEAIVAYNKEKLLEPFNTKWPVVKVLINTESKTNPFVYKHLIDLEIKSADIVVDVSEVSNLVIQNDRSLLDPGKPFQPFGNRPIVTSNFYLGSWEVFQKSLNELKVNIKWFGLPSDEKGFEGYYKNYQPATDPRINSSFKVKSALLHNKSWITVSPVSKTLFDDTAGGKLLNKKVLNFPNSAPADEPPEKIIGNVDRNYELSSFDEYDQESKKGFLRLSLDGKDFGHKDYHRSYTKAVLDAINPPAPVEDYSGDLPNEPYTPEIETISLDYVSTVKLDTVNLSTETFSKRVEQFFHVHPMGVAEIQATKKSNFLFPQYKNEGELYIGIKELDPPQNLSILFQISEGTSNPDLKPPKVTWSYLASDEWTPFPDQNILSDSTKGLITTGIILFDIPSKASKNNNSLTNGLHWFKASVEKDSNGIPHIIDIKCQVAKVEFKDVNNDPEYLSKPLPEKTISKMVVADSSIKKIEQPFTSFGGRIKEESGDFYTRVSERLRHKNRSITIWDYERIILQNFPSVYKAKCLNHTRYEGTFASINEASPGHVSLIIVSNIRNRNAVDPLKPRTSLVLLEDISTFIQQLQSPYVKLHVFNPLFEEVKVKFNVKFHPGFDKGIYKVKLGEALIKFLSPWAYESGSDIVFGGKIHKSVILNFVEEQLFVDYITCFEMFHFVPDDPDNDPAKDVDEAIASTSASILGSSAIHEITVLETEEECACQDNVVETFKLSSSDECPCD